MATLKGIWVFNDTVSVPTGGLSWSVNFVSNGTNYSTIRHDEDSDVMGTNAVYYDTTEVYSIVFSDWWANEAYKTVDFGTTEQTVDDTFYAWLTANATQQASEEEEPTTSGATVEYNGSVVATIENGNKATLPIKDLKMKSDIVVTVPEATDSPLPVEVSTEAEMTSLLTNGTVGGVYKYTGTTGTYENGALYVLENNLITFTIGGTTYQAEEGMTWAEWAESDYDTNYLCAARSWGLCWVGGSAEFPLYLNGVEVSADDLVISGATYTSDYMAGGGGSN